MKTVFLYADMVLNTDIKQYINRYSCFERDINDKYSYYLLCENCGHLYEFDMNLIMQRYFG